MLAKANRITTGDDYRFVVRRGAKIVGAHTVSYARSREAGADVRFGFIVSKKVGNAVVRNRVRRRLKAAAFETVSSLENTDIVVRALPSAAEACWRDLRSDVHQVADRRTRAGAGTR